MNSQNCPCCPNHCEKSNLGCGRGVEYYNNLSNPERQKTASDEVISDLRRCGHILHHNESQDTSSFLSGLTDEEIDKLHELLSKVCNSFE